MSELAFDPKLLPPPNSIPVPGFDVLFRENIEQFKERNPEYAYFLASDPAVMLLQHIAYRELLYRQLHVERDRARFATWASGADLDNLGAHFNVARAVVTPAAGSSPAVLESDTRFRERVLLAMSARSEGGTAEGYKLAALTADVRVKDALVFSPDLPGGINTGGRVVVSILSSEGNGTPSLEILGNVRDYLQSPKVKVVSDIIQVEPVVMRAVTVDATVLLERNTPKSVLVNLQTAFEQAFEANKALGWDVAQSWITKTLSVAGIASVTVNQPSASIAVRANECAFLSSVTIRFGGFVVADEITSDELSLQQLTNRVVEYYLDFAILNERTKEAIEEDLTAIRREGVVQAHFDTVIAYLGLQSLAYNEVGLLRPGDELAFLIHQTISRFYGTGSRP